MPPIATSPRETPTAGIEAYHQTKSPRSSASGGSTPFASPSRASNNTAAGKPLSSPRGARSSTPLTVSIEDSNSAPPSQSSNRSALPRNISSAATPLASGSMAAPPNSPDSEADTDIMNSPTDDDYEEDDIQSTPTGCSSRVSLATDTTHPSGMPTPSAAAAPNITSSSSEREVPYGTTGVTTLFRAIEDGDWDTALRECQTHPGDVRVWVKSSGTENTVFNWSVWRRLPIHEACRRQPPPVLIATLLAIHPDSAMATTHFGELPIHLAAGCGASPDVINLLIAANFLGIAARDNGGRTPLEIMNENGVIRNDSTLVTDTLERCQRTLGKYEADWESHVRKIYRENDSAIAKIRKEHERELSKKDEVISDLQKDIQKGKYVAEDLTSQIDEFEEKVTQKNESERQLMDHIRKLEEEITSLRKQNRAVRRNVQQLEETKLQNEKTIQKLNDRVAVLSGDFHSIISEQDRIVERSMCRAEADLKAMMESQKIFMRKVAKHRERVRCMTRERGIDIPQSTRNGSMTPSNENKATPIPPTPVADPPKDIDTSNAAKAAASAAAAAVATIE